MINLKVSNLACRRGQRLIFAGVSFELAAGSGLRLRGPNGAGKTTLLRTIAGFLRPAHGTITLERTREGAGGAHMSNQSGGKRGRERESGRRSGTEGGSGKGGSGSGAAGGSDSDLEAQSVRPAEVGEACHFVGHANGLKAAFTVRENLAFWQSFLAETRDPGRLDRALERFELSALEDIPAGYLSAGQKRRLGLARLLVAERPVWLLDEPTVSLDARSAEILGTVANEHMARGGIVIAATHVALAIDLAHELELDAGRHRIEREPTDGPRPHDPHTADASERPGREPFAP